MDHRHLPRPTSRAGRWKLGTSGPAKTWGRDCRPLPQSKPGLPPHPYGFLPFHHHLLLRLRSPCKPFGRTYLPRHDPSLSFCVTSFVIRHLSAMAQPDRASGLSPGLVETVSGLSAGTVATLVVHPLDIVKTRMQSKFNYPSFRPLPSPADQFLNQSIAAPLPAPKLPSPQWPFSDRWPRTTDPSRPSTAA